MPNWKQYVDRLVYRKPSHLPKNLDDIQTSGNILFNVKIRFGYDTLYTMAWCTHRMPSTATTQTTTSETTAAELRPTEQPAGATGTTNVS
jgi:hypothetical protein